MFCKRGFTLIEVLIVVIILGILATISIPNFTNMVERARKSEALTNLSAIVTGQRAYHLEHGNYIACANSDEILTNLGVDVTSAKFFTYTATVTEARATRSGHWIEIRYSDSLRRGSTNNPWGESTSWN
jgi:type IV pilus assembly protein PilA